MKNVKVGDKFFFTNHVKPKLYTIKDIVVNSDAGKPLCDMWGHEVWSAPKYTIKAYADGDEKDTALAVQSDTQNLDGWLTFVKDEEEYKKSSTSTARKNAKMDMAHALDDMHDKFNTIRALYEDTLSDDEWFNFVMAEEKRFYNIL